MSLRHVFLCSLFLPITVFAKPVITALEHSDPHLVNSIAAAVQTQVNADLYREIRVKIVHTSAGLPDHAVLHMLAKGFHRVDLASYDLDHTGKPVLFHSQYKLKAGDQPLYSTATCPDPSVEFIAFAPNDDSTEQGVTVAVAQAAQKAGLKTVSLLITAATGQAYLNYMSCPNLKGNFYDGDADPTVITTTDGTLSSDDIQGLAGAFREKVTNIWLACEAFNDPMLSAVLTGAKAQKYAAGINDLEVGPSDQAGACAMEAAIQGQAMTAAFQSCYKQFDDPSDQWGFQGEGSDYFGQ